MISKNQLNNIEMQKLAELKKDPIKWAQVFLKSFNPKSKKIEPWIGRWYQVG